MISRAELGKYPLQLKVHSQMIKTEIHFTRCFSEDLRTAIYRNSDTQHR